MKNTKMYKLKSIIITAFIFVMFFSQISIINAEENNIVNAPDSTNSVANSLIATGTVVHNENNQSEGIQVDNEYYSVNTGRFVTTSQTQSNYYLDNEGNSFAIYIQPTTSIDTDASNYYYEDIYSESMLKNATKSLLESIDNQNNNEQFFNGIDESKVTEIQNVDGDSYPALFWKFSIKHNNANYFFYVYEIIDKNIMYNLTFSATSYYFLENNNIDSIINSFKIKNYQEFDHKPNNGNIVNSAIHSKSLSKVIGICAAVVVLVIISLIIKMKRVNKEELEMIHEKEKELGIDQNKKE